MEFIDKITVAVLAGGKSRRFGSSKLDALYKGKRLFDIALDIAASISPNVIVISNQVGLTTNLSYPIYPDIFIEKGPLAGIHSALKNAVSEHVAILPIDMPFLGKPIYKYLMTRYNCKVPVVVKSQKGLEPLVSIWPKAVLSEIESCLEQEHLGIFKCLHGLNADISEIPTTKNFDERVFININRKEDLNCLL